MGIWDVPAKLWHASQFCAAPLQEIAFAGKIIVKSRRPRTYQCDAMMPPSTGKTIPVMKLDAFDDKKIAAPAISVGSPMRFLGTLWMS
jgi:hypothetical protein